MTESHNPFLPFALPKVGDEEISEVVDTLKSGWVNTGPKAKRFEPALTEFLGDPSLEPLAVNPSTAEVVRYLVTDGLHLQPNWRGRYRLTPQQFPDSQGAFERMVSLPLHTRMTHADAVPVCAAVRSALL